MRRQLLTILYERYLLDPLEMLTPDDFLANGQIARADLVANMHYLNDRRLIELMIGYNPPMFAAARITADGIDLVENRFEFNLLFPPRLGREEEAVAALPRLMEDLVSEAEFSAIDGEERRSLLRDVEYLRDEFARPAHRWRWNVIQTVLEWMAEKFEDPAAALPSLTAIRTLVTKEKMAR